MHVHFVFAKQAMQQRSYYTSADVQAVLDITGGVVSDPMLFKSVLLQELDEQSRVLKVILRECSSQC